MASSASSASSLPATRTLALAVAVLAVAVLAVAVLAVAVLAVAALRFRPAAISITNLIGNLLFMRALRPPGVCRIAVPPLLDFLSLLEIVFDSLADIVRVLATGSSAAVIVLVCVRVTFSTIVEAVEWSAGCRGGH